MDGPLPFLVLGMPLSGDSLAPYTGLSASDKKVARVDEILQPGVLELGLPTFRDRSNFQMENESAYDSRRDAEIMDQS